MITRQHAALLFWAICMRRGSLKDAIWNFREEIPWALLPDGIRAYIGPRQAGHFEQAPNGDVAWMKYPNEVTLKLLTKESSIQLVDFYVPNNVFPKCVIGEDTQIDVFDVKNKHHAHYHAIRSHLRQDIILDRVLRTELIDVSRRFEDIFVVRHSGQEIDGAELRRQVGLFEEFGFIHLLGKIYAKTGEVLDGEWFVYNIYEPLLKAYPADLARNTFKYMMFPHELQARVKANNFVLSKEEIESVYMTKDLISCLDAMYDKALVETATEMSK